MSVRRIAVVALAAVLAVVSLEGRAPITIKLATQVPVNSTWHKALLEMGAEWDAKTSSRVKLTVYAGGTQGSEEATIRMMRPGVDQLQGNLLTVAGLATVDEAFNVFGMPFFFANDAETAYVLEKLTPMLEKRLEGKGFKLVCWGSGGWVQLFSKEPIRTLDEVKAAKLFTSQGDDKMVQWYKGNGFHPVALSNTDIPAQLKLTTGMINAAPMPPYLAMFMQIFRDAKYMLDIRVAPLVGALVLTNEAWTKIEANDRPVVTAAAKTFEKRVMTEAPAQDATSVTTMSQRGLTVTTPDAKAVATFRTEAERLTATMRGGMVPADVYDAALRERDAFRKMKK